MQRIEIKKSKKLTGGWVKVDLILNTDDLGVIAIKGFRVRESLKSAEIWVQEPSYQVHGRYYRCVYFEKRQVWEEVKSVLIDEFRRVISSGEKEEEVLGFDG